jgi:hypothetical protein
MTEKSQRPSPWQYLSAGAMLVLSVALALLGGYVLLGNPTKIMPGLLALVCFTIALCVAPKAFRSIDNIARMRRGSHAR